MPKLKLPVIAAGENVYPSKAICPWCRKRKVFEPNSFAVLTGGAMFGRLNSKNGGPDLRMTGFVGMTWHGAHGHGVGAHRDHYVRVDIVKDSSDGQFELYFCTPKCLRAFLNHCVDELESRIKHPARGQPKGVDPLAGVAEGR